MIALAAAGVSFPATNGVSFQAKSTPLGGSWLNMAESVQRILVRRALDGQQPTSAQQVMAWLATTVRGWNAAPTQFVWGGRRRQRRVRARQRRHALHATGGSGAVTHVPIPRRRSHPKPYERLCASQLTH